MKELLAEYSQDPQALKAIRTLFSTRESLFLTGCAGTGKTRLLGRMMSHLTKPFVLLAPTGLSAMNSGAQTIHSFFRLPQRTFTPEDEDIPVSDEVAELVEHVEVIIVDDVSLVRADLMNAMDISLRKHAGMDEPFGGKQMLFAGDLYQSAPAEDLVGLYPTKFFFGAPVFTEGFHLHVIELEQGYRYKDPEFFSIIRQIRKGRPDQETVKKINSRVIEAGLTEEEDPRLQVTFSALTTDRINREKFEQLLGVEYSYQALESGLFTDYSVDTGCPAERILKVKPDARVKFIQNDPDGRWSMGSGGRITDYSDDMIEVRLDGGGEPVQVMRSVWQSFEYAWDPGAGAISRKETGTLEQFPIRVLWAENVKSLTGQEFRNSIIDIGSGAFVHGQAYLALSRCGSLDDVQLRSQVRAEDFIADESVTRYLTGATSIARNDALWSMLMGQAGPDHLQELEELKEHNRVLQESHIDMRRAIENHRGDIFKKNEKITALTAQVEELQKKADSVEGFQESTHQEIKMLEKKIRKKDRWINFLLVIQLIYFIAVLAWILYQMYERQ
jgi:hypothetical protein